MRYLRLYWCTLCLLLVYLTGCSKNEEASGTTAVLVFTKTAGFRHTSIEAGVNAIRQLGVANGFEVYETANATLINTKNLSRYRAVIFLNTTGDILNSSQQTAFEDYIRKGGGFVGIHSATDTEYDWPWYGGLVGAYFKNHPDIQPATLQVVSPGFTNYQQLPTPWTRTDEWYNFRALAAHLNVLVTVNESSYTGGEHGSTHPVTWWHNYSGGRSFYTAMGHTEESYTNPDFLQHLLGGILYAIGD